MTMQLSFYDTDPPFDSRASDNTDPLFDSHASWLVYLSESLHYPAAQLSYVSSLDVVTVCRDGKQRECLAVIADQRPNHQSTLSRLRQLANQLAAEFVALGSPDDYELFQADVYGISPAPVKKLPTWIPSLSRHTLIARKHALLPFRSDDQLRKAVAACHDELYIDSG